MDERFRGHYDEWNKNRLGFIVQRWGQSWFRGKRILELGCGHAYIGRALARLGAIVVCSDARPEHLAFVQQRAPEIETVQANLNREWPFSGRFDLILHLGVLYHLEDIHFSLEQSFAHADNIVLETEVLDSLPEKCLQIDEDSNLYDQSFTGKGTRPSASYLENIFHRHQFYAFRLADDRCNAEHEGLMHVYDWPCHDTGQWQHGKRRLWVLAKKTTVPPPTSSNLSVVVQGQIVGHNDPKPRRRITQQCIAAIRKHLPEAEVIVSSWEGSQTDGLDQDVLVLNGDPGGICCDDVYGVTNNVNRQVVSSLAGIQQASRPYCLKIRSDLILQSNRFLKYWGRFSERQWAYSFTAERLLTCSVFARRYAGEPGNVTRTPFHPGDFLFFGFREDLRNLFDIPLAPEPATSRWFEHHAREQGVHDCYEHSHCRFFPEQHIWLSFLRKYLHIPMEHRLDLNHEALAHDTPSIVNNLVILDQAQWRFALPKYQLRQYTLPHHDWNGLYRHALWRQHLAELCGAHPRWGFTYDSAMRYIFHDGRAARRLERKAPKLFTYVQKRLRKQKYMP